MSAPDPTPLHGLPASLRQRLDAALQPGEQVAWAGMPGPLVSMLPSLAGFVFGVAWSSIAFTFEAVSIASLLSDAPERGMSTGMALIFTIFGLPFVLIGLAFLGAPFAAAARAMLTVHAVTDRRLLTVVGGPFPSVESKLAQALTFVRRRDRRHGRGSLRLGFGTERDSDGDTRSIETRWPDVPAVEAAEQAIRRLAESVGRRF